MKKLLTTIGLTLVVMVVAGIALGVASSSAGASGGQKPQPGDAYSQVRIADSGFEVEVLVNGRRVTEYAARGRRYIEAQEGAEYSLRIHNPLPARVAVALSVDGLNTIDARHTSAWDAHKWVIEPYGTIEVGGWQMSSNRARRFYFTTEQDSYGAKLGQAANLGVISAVFFRERRPVVITEAPRRPRNEEQDRSGMPESDSRDTPAAKESNRGSAQSRSAIPVPDDESAATGIGRSVRNDVQWVRMDLDPQAVNDVTIRYEYRAGLVRLGIVPRDYPRPEVIDRRERARGFDPFCPEP